MTGTPPGKTRVLCRALGSRGEVASVAKKDFDRIGPGRIDPSVVENYGEGYANYHEVVVWDDALVDHDAGVVVAVDRVDQVDATIVMGDGAALARYDLSVVNKVGPPGGEPPSAVSPPRTGSMHP